MKTAKQKGIKGKSSIKKSLINTREGFLKIKNRVIPGNGKKKYIYDGNLEKKELITISCSEYCLLLLFKVDPLIFSHLIASNSKKTLHFINLCYIFQGFI